MYNGLWLLLFILIYSLFGQLDGTNNQVITGLQIFLKQNMTVLDCSGWQILWLS